MAAGALTYWNSLSGPFIFDDRVSIVANRHIRQWWHLASLLLPDRESPVAGRPIVNLSFAINYAMGGLEVGGYHLWNVTIHLLCALLVFGVVRRTLELPGLHASFGFRAHNLAFATALIWMLHPLNTEAVDYLTQRSESMMALFYLLTVYASIRGIRSDRGMVWRVIAVLSCALGMACKESMVTAPLMVVLYDRIFVFGSVKQEFRARWRFYAGLATTWLVLAALVWSGPRAHSAGFSTDVDPWTYLLNQSVMIARYLRLAVWPRSLVLNYGWPLPLTFGDVMPYALLITLLLLLTLAALVWRPQLGFLGTWFFVTLAPTSSLVPIATEVGAERRMYLPMVTLVTLAVIGGSLLWDLARSTWRGRAVLGNPRVWSLGGALVLVVVSAVLAASTIARNREYRSSLSLARTLLERWPTSIAHQLMGSELMIAGHYEEAVQHLREALPGAPRAHYALGVELFREGKLDEAIEQLQAFVRKQPLHREVISARTIMGRAFARQERWPQAIEQFRLILTLTPSNAEAQKLLADSLFAQQTFDESGARYKAYLRSHPNDAGALTNLGIALAATGKVDEALLTFRRAVDVDSRNGIAQGNLATALLDRGNVEEAALHAQEAVTLRPEDPGAHDLLGRAFALQGKFDEARAQFERALQIDPAYAKAREDLRRTVRPRGSPRTPLP